MCFPVRSRVTICGIMGRSTIHVRDFRLKERPPLSKLGLKNGRVKRQLDSKAFPYEDMKYALREGLYIFHRHVKYCRIRKVCDKYKTRAFYKLLL